MFISSIKMDNLDDSENNAKVSDSGYSHSCSNSQSRSQSSKSTHSGSHSSGSSGYGGKPSSSSNDAADMPEKSARTKDKEAKKKFISQIEVTHSEKDEDIANHGQELAVEEKLEVEDDMVINVPSIPSDTHAEVESMDISSCGSVGEYEELPMFNHSPAAASCKSMPRGGELTEGFACVISMHDGVVMYNSSTVTPSLGYPRDMWIGRSFIDFLHPKDRSTFASQITNSLAMPKNIHGASPKIEDSLPRSKGSIPCEYVPDAVPVPLPPAISDDYHQNFKSKMFCRIRRYRGLSTAFSVKQKDVVYVPFLLMLSFRNIIEEETKTIFLVIQATPFFSAFKVSNEVLPKPTPFVLRHSANGKLEYIDPESVAYLGYLPQDLADKDVLQFLHPDDMPYIQMKYEELVKKGHVPDSKPYRILCNNGDYVKVATEWSAVINPWSRKLEYVVGKHLVVEGPYNPDVFCVQEKQSADDTKEIMRSKLKVSRENILRIMNEVLTKPAEVARQNISKRCQLLMTFMEGIVDDTPKKPPRDSELKLDIHETDHNYKDSLMCDVIFQEADSSVVLGVISPHHSDSKSSTETPLSYTQLNYKETLQRYFESYVNCLQESPNEEENKATATKNKDANRNKDSTKSKDTSKTKDTNKTDEKDSTKTKDNNATKNKDKDGTKRKNKDATKIKNKDSTKNKDKNATKNKDKDATKNKEKDATTSMDTSTDPSLYFSTDRSTNKKPAPYTYSDQEERKLTQTLLSKHNVEMQKDLAKKIRELRSSAKSDRQKTLSEHKQKKKEHIARCNAPYYPTMIEMNGGETQSHGLKRLTDVNSEDPNVIKYGDNSHRRKRQKSNPAIQVVQETPIHPPQMCPEALTPGFTSRMMPVVSPVVSGVVPMYYVPTSTTVQTNNLAVPNTLDEGHNSVQYLMYLQAVYGSSIMYSPIAPPQYTLPPSIILDRTQKPVGLTNTNYVEACKPPGVVTNKAQAPKVEGGSGDSVGSSKMSTKPPHTLTISNEDSNRTSLKILETGSSYSSYYSSFFNTESGSAEDSDGKLKHNNKNEDRTWKRPTDKDSAMEKLDRNRNLAQVPKKKAEPPWMENINVTPELVFKYQVKAKNAEEVLQEDKCKMEKMEQPSLVNEQMGQLLMDLQLNGEAPKLTFDEGITSSSSGDEINDQHKFDRRRREYNKTVMLFEENAPFPPSPQGSYSAEPVIETM